jgi:hypothetical protein
METGQILERIVRAYDGPWEYCKESAAQKAAQAQQTAFTAQLQQIYLTQFAEDQAILQQITPQLESIATSPQGFGATEYAALQAGIVNTTGQQYANAAKQAATQFAVANEAGLPSGVQQQVQGQLAGAAAGQVASQSSALAIANEQMKQQQQQYALSTLGGLYGQTGSMAGQTAGQTLTGIGGEFGQATQVYNQGSLWQNILSGVASSAAGNTMNYLSSSGSFLNQSGNPVLNAAGQIL